MNLHLKTYQDCLKNDFLTFAQRCFYELHPETPFKYNWHLELIAESLRDCMDGKVRRLILNIPPRSLKSILGSVVLPAFWLGHYPSAKIMCVSYGQDLADKHALDTRILMQSQMYKSIFDTRLMANKTAVSDFATTRMGERHSVSVGGAVTGRGADVMIIDDPLKADDAMSDARRQAANDFVDNSLFSRINDKETGCIIVIMQRLHQDDLTGHLLEKGGWKVVSLPAIAEADEVYAVRNIFGSAVFTRTANTALQPNHESLAILHDQRAAIGEYNFQAQYQQNPTPPGGALIKRDWLRHYNQDDLPKFGSIVQSWDTAIKAHSLADFSVCTTWLLHRDKYYLLDVYRKRLEYPDLKRAVRKLAERFDPDHILIEDKGSGSQLIQELQREGQLSIKRYDPRNDEKIMRVYDKTAYFENGKILLPTDAVWLDDYIRELTAFPGSKFDDQMDSTVQMLDHFKANRSSWIIISELLLDEEEENARMAAAEEERRRRGPTLNSKKKPMPDLTLSDEDDSQ